MRLGEAGSVRDSVLVILPWVRLARARRAPRPGQLRSERRRYLAPVAATNGRLATEPGETPYDSVEGLAEMAVRRWAVGWITRAPSGHSRSSGGHLRSRGGSFERARLLAKVGPGAANGGKKLASIEVGPGIDSIDYDESRHELFVAAGKAAKLAIAKAAHARRPRDDPDRRGCTQCGRGRRWRRVAHRFARGARSQGHPLIPRTLRP